MRNFDAILSRVAALLLLASLATVQGQQTPVPPQPQPSVHPGTPGPAGDRSGNDDDILARRLALQQAVRRNDQRQQQIVDDTTKLLQLAQELKDDVQKSNKNMLSLAVVKKAEEIEKLAKTVKDKMREGQ